MAQATLVPPPRIAADEAGPRVVVARAPSSALSFRFESLVLSEPRSVGTRRGATLAVSLIVHSILVVAVVVVPLFLYDYHLPAPDEAVLTVKFTFTSAAAAKAGS